jgi:tRNA 2-selenouridine synthase
VSAGTRNSWKAATRPIAAWSSKTSPSIPRQLQFKVLCGATGSAKSRILQAIGRRGEQVLDLEELACHKGSVLGVLPDCPQPSQKMFESRLLTALQGFDRDRPVYVEAESRKIGSLQVPAALIETMRGGECFISKRLSTPGSIFSCATTTISCLHPSG